MSGKPKSKYIYTDTKIYVPYAVDCYCNDTKNTKYNLKFIIRPHSSFIESRDIELYKEELHTTPQFVSSVIRKTYNKTTREFEYHIYAHFKQ